MWKIKVDWFAVFLGIVGFVLVGWFSHPLVALGLFLAMWGNNISMDG